MVRTRKNKRNGQPKTVSLPVAMGGAKAQGGKVSGQSVLSVPAASGKVTKGTPPNILASSKHDGRILVRHREFVSDVFSGNGLGQTFGLTTKTLNPGIQASFPWLSGLAAQYESYQFKYLLLEYVASVGTSAEGSVCIAVDYDAADPSPANKADLMSFHSAVRGPIWSPSLSFVCSKPDLSRFGVQRFVRKLGLAANLDQKTYDIGKVHLAVIKNGDEIAEPVPVGELYVEYEVELITPHPNMDSPSEYSAEIVSGGVITTAAPFGTVSQIQQGYTVVKTALDKVLEISIPGQYLADCRVTGTNVTDALPLVTVSEGSAETKPVDSILKADGTMGFGQWAINVIRAPCKLDLTYVGRAAAVSALITRLMPAKYSIMG